jgi:hypothetical protein
MARGLLDTPFVGGIANAFGGKQAPAPVESRGTAAATEAKEAAMAARNAATEESAREGFSPPDPGGLEGTKGDQTGDYPSEGGTGQGIGGTDISGQSESPSADSIGSPAIANGGLLALAQGGMSNLGSYSDGGRLLRGPGDGVSDSIPAMIGRKQQARLADGEFVIPARIVSELGNGSTEAGARQLYAMMDRVQKARKKTVGKDKVAANSRAAKLLPA